MTTYDQWKTTDRLDPDRPCFGCRPTGFWRDDGYRCEDCADQEAFDAREPLAEEDLDQIDFEQAESPPYYVEPRHRTYAVVDERDGRDVEHFPIGRDYREALALAETLRDKLNEGAHV